MQSRGPQAACVVSHDVFVRRLMRDGRHAELDRASIILIARLAFSRARRTLRSLRIAAVAPPFGYFLPINRRLSSVGLRELVKQLCRKYAWEASHLRWSNLFARDKSILAHRQPSLRVELHKRWRPGAEQAVSAIAAGHLLDFG